MDNARFPGYITLLNSSKPLVEYLFFYLYKYTSDISRYSFVQHQILVLTFYKGSSDNSIKFLQTTISSKEEIFIR